MVVIINMPRYFRSIENSKCPSNNPICDDTIYAEPFSCSRFKMTKEFILQHQLAKLNQSNNPASYQSKETPKGYSIIYDQLSYKKSLSFTSSRNYSTRNIDYKLNDSGIYNPIHPILDKSGKSKFGYSGVGQDSYRNN